MNIQLDPLVLSQPSLSRLLAHLKDQGFKHELQVLPDGHVWCVTQGKQWSAAQLHVRSFQRFDDQSDPADNLLVAAVGAREAAPDGCRGVLVLGFGPAASAEHKRVLASLQVDTHHASVV